MYSIALILLLVLMPGNAEDCCLKLEIKNFSLSKEAMTFELMLYNYGEKPALCMRPNSIYSLFELELVGKKKKAIYLFEGRVFDLSQIEMDCYSSIILHKKEIFIKKFELKFRDFSLPIEYGRFSLMVTIDHSKARVNSQFCGTPLCRNKVMSNKLEFNIKAD